MANYPIYRLIKGNTLSFTEMDGNLEWLSKNLSGSQVIISGSTDLTGSLFVKGPVSISGSLANGIDNVASGIYSHAEGQEAQAIGYASHAEGEQTLAIGDNSHAEGNNSQAIGSNSHAEGIETKAIGGDSHAEGYQTATGTQNAYYATSVVNGLVTLSSSYGDETSYFYSGDLLVFNDSFGDNNYNTTAFIIDTVTYNAPSTKIQLVNTSVNTTAAKVGDLNQIQDWNGDQTIPGDYSHAEGYQTAVFREYSHTEGFRTYAIGAYSHAEGDETISRGGQSHAEGSGTQAIGDYSHAEGGSTQAIGAYSHAEGDGTQAIEYASHAEGDITEAIGHASHAEGFNARAVGIGSHAEGEYTKTGILNAYYATSVIDGLITLSASYGDVSLEFNSDDWLIFDDTFADDEYGLTKFLISSATYNAPSTEIQLVDNPSTTVAKVRDNSAYGDQIIPGDYSHAEGSETEAVGPYSHAEGRVAISIGNYSHAEGSTTKAFGDYSHAEGEFTQAVGNGAHSEGDANIALGNYSHAEGQLTKTIGYYSHAEGFFTQAIGSFSHAEGNQTIANSQGSHAEGNNTVASGDYQHVQGQYNISSSDKSAFIIGNGIDDLNRSNLVFASGSTFQITGSLIAPSITGSLFGTASWAQSASIAINAISASYVSGSGAIVTNLTSSNDASINGITVGRGNGNDQRNTIIGYEALNNNPGDIYYDNVAIGYLAMSASTEAYENVAIGSEALRRNKTGYNNVAIGHKVLNFSTSSYDNVALGQYALGGTGESSENVVLGYFAIGNYSTKNSVVIGFRAGQNSNNGEDNVMIGNRAGSNILSSSNTIVGTYSGGNLGSANNNTLVGSNNGVFLYGGEYNTLIGSQIQFVFNGNNRNYNTIIGSQISSLAIGLSNNIILADGQGNIKYRWDGTQNTISGGLNVTGGPITGSDALLTGTLTVQTIVAQTITASTEWITGSSKFGSLVTDTHQFTGSVLAPSITGSLLGTSSWAVSASWSPAQLNGTGFVKASGTTITYDNSTYYSASNPNGYTSNTGTVTSITVSPGTGMSGGGTVTTNGTVTLTNAAPDQTVVLTQGGTTVITGTYPNFTITSNDQYVGTVTSVTGTGTVSGLTLTGTVSTTGNLTLGGTLSLTSANVTDGLGYTPYNSTNPDGYVSNAADTYTGTPKITNIVTLSAAEYAAIGSPSTSTLYIII